MWGLLRYFYVLINRTFGTTGTTGTELSELWWVFAGLYYVVDVVALTAMSVFLKPGDASRIERRKAFWHNISEIVPFLFVFHFAMFVFEYPISTRLESAGLGIIEAFAGVASIIVIAGALFRSREAER